MSLFEFDWSFLQSSKFYSVANRAARCVNKNSSQIVGLAEHFEISFKGTSAKVLCSLSFFFVAPSLHQCRDIRFHQRFFSFLTIMRGSEDGSICGHCHMHVSIGTGGCGEQCDVTLRGARIQVLCNKVQHLKNLSNS